jgi:hypothetical protein
VGSKKRRRDTLVLSVDLHLGTGPRGGHEKVIWSWLCDIKRGFFYGNAGACMKLAGFFLLLAGWAIALAALVVIGSGAALTAFILTGVCVEILGAVLVIRSHLPARGNGA